MPSQTDINPRLVEGLYCEALVLSDEARARFDRSRREAGTGAGEDEAQIALSCEALRTTTRMMQAIAWLLRQRASLAAGIGGLRMQAHGQLRREWSLPDPARLALLPAEVVELIEATVTFHARLVRLDEGLRANRHGPASGISHLRARLGRAYSA